MEPVSQLVHTKSMDLETFLITRERPAPTIVCLSWSFGRATAVIPHGDALLRWVETQLKNPQVRLVGHNMAYDMKCLMANYPHLAPLIFDAYRLGRITDTGIRQQMWDIATGRAQGDDAVRAYRLSDLVKLVFDRDITKWKSGPDAWRLRYGELYGKAFVDWPDAALEYPKIDADETLAVYEAQREKVADKIRDDSFMSYGAFALDLMATSGMVTDGPAVAALKAKNQALLERLRPTLVEGGLIRLKGPKRGPKKWVKNDKVARQRMEDVCAEKGIEPFYTNSESDIAKGKPRNIAIDKAACFLVDDELLHIRRKYVAADKILNTYVPPLEQGHQGLPISTRFGVAATTRTTSSAPSKPMVGTNMQNAPRDGGVRECYIPRPGYIYMAGDFSGAELHALAQVCKRVVGYSVLGDTLAAGRDVHLFLAAELLRITYEEAKELRASGNKDVKDARQHAKVANFGFAGSMGIPTFMKNQLKEGKVYTHAAAKDLKDVWLAAFPEMQGYFEYCKRELGPTESTVIEMWPGGPLRRVKGLATICNTYFQALVARGAKAAACEIVRQCYAVPDSLLSGTRPCNFVHDEVIAETPLADVDTLDARARFFAKTMEDKFNVWVPDYPTKVDTVLMQRWSKNAEPTYDQQGRLIPWQPV